MRTTTIPKPARIFAAAAMLLSSGALAADGGGLTRDAVAEWLAGYEEAWESLDADKAAALFTEEATYQENPHAEPFRGRQGVHDYWSTVTADQQDVDFSYDVLAVTERTGIAHWRSEFTQKSSGSNVVLDGVFVLEFTPEGLCSSLREWWHVQAGSGEAQP